MLPNCPHCPAQPTTAPDSRRIVRFGFFRRTSDSRVIQRYRCAKCKHTFSRATYHVCFRQKKRHKNHAVFKLLVSNVSQRRTAEILCLNRKTVVRKLLFLAKRAETELAGGFDPIFSINHSLASLRANINRLIRQTWCTTKRPDRLAAHLHLYVSYHNRKVLKRAC